MARGKPRPGHPPSPALVYAPAAKVLKRVMAVPEGTEQQVPAKTSKPRLPKLNG
ncbi:hypothetical protein ECXG_04219 [Escherichia coli TA447]|uniref:Uncharacterized protein n=1 Tax=Escherichia coli TA447 TaxID=656447 RepID=A0A1X3IU49_ECOLX|nr:hypothetical protein ECXG_04219 [Escherichia coli TA447]